MVEKIKIALLNLSSAIQAGKIYSKAHPSFQEFIIRAFKTLHEVLPRKKELVIGIVEDELAWEGEIFFSLSQKLNALVFNEYADSRTQPVGQKLCALRKQGLILIYRGHFNSASGKPTFDLF